MIKNSEEAVKILDEIYKEMNKLREENSKLKELLEKAGLVEYDNSYFCPICQREITYGHTKDCSLAKVLKDE